MNIAFVNGEYCPLSEAKISVFDRGFLFGDAIYEVLPVYNGQAFFVDRHIARLNSNLNKVKIQIPDYDWDHIINELIVGNNSGNLQVYIHVTRGNQGMRKHDIPSSIHPSVIAFTMHNRFPTLAEKEQGLSAKLIDDIRWQRCDIKTTSLMANILLNDDAITSGYETSILIRDRKVTEGSVSNVFIVTKDNLVKVPPLNHFCLPGVTRQIALELMQELNWAVIEEEFTVDELLSAREVWITSTTKEIYPITKIDNSLVNQGMVGDFWRTLNQSYQQLIS